MVGEHQHPARPRRHGRGPLQQIAYGQARQRRPPLQQLAVAVHRPAHHLHPGHDAVEPHHLGGPVGGGHRHPHPAGAPAGVVAPARRAQPPGPEAHVGVVGPAHQRRPGRQAARPVGVADHHAHPHRLAVAGDRVLVGPQALHVAGPEAAQGPVPALGGCDLAAQLVLQELALGQVLADAVQPVAGRVLAGDGQLVAHRHGGGALAAHPHRGDVESVTYIAQGPAEPGQPGLGIGPARRPRVGPVEPLAGPGPHPPVSGQGHGPDPAAAQVHADDDGVRPVVAACVSGRAAAHAAACGAATARGVPGAHRRSAGRRQRAGISRPAPDTPGRWRPAPGRRPRRRARSGR